MSKREFKVGDRVRKVSDFNAGAIGTVKYIQRDDKVLPFAVEFDTSTLELHDCFGRTKRNHGWWCASKGEDKIELFTNETSIIQKGRTVIAMRNGKKGIARCCPEDTFDLKTGIDLALKRLEEKENYGKPFVPESAKSYFHHSWLVNCSAITSESIYAPAYFTDELFVTMGDAWRTKEEAVEHTAEIQEKMKKVLAYAKTL